MARAIPTLFGLLLIGCFDLTFDEHPHVITDLEILAIHVEPPEIEWNTPLYATVLYADPNGQNRLIQTVWRIRYYRETNDTQPVADFVVTRTDPTNQPLRLSPPSRLRAFRRGDAPAVRLDVFLCRGDLKDVNSIRTKPVEETLTNLCSGDVVTGVKGITSPSPISYPGPHGEADAISEEILFKQHNPSILQLEVDGVALSPLEEGGEIHTLCADQRDCDRRPVSLQATLDHHSADIFTLIPRDDTGLAIQYRESLRVDWYVTEGALYPPSSYQSSFTDTSIVRPENTEYAFRTTWQLPTLREAKQITLYVIARDERGGNDWRTYSFDLGTP